MRIYFVREMRQNQCTRAGFEASNARGPQGRVHWTSIKTQRKCIEFVAFLEQNKCKFINLIHTRQKKGKYFSYVHEKMNKLVWKYHPASKIKTYLPSEKIHRSNQPLFARVRIKSMPRNHGRSTRSALDIFNALRVLLILLSDWLTQTQSV